MMDSSCLVAAFTPFLVNGFNPMSEILELFISGLVYGDKSTSKVYKDLILVQNVG